jgi:hypothetical protein
MGVEKLGQKVYESEMTLWMGNIKTYGELEIDCKMTSIL